MLVLGIETSCDDTSLALYDDARGVLDVCTAAQIAHDRYGGVVPEIASREHVRTIVPVYEALLARAGVSASRIDGIAVTAGPGLVGSLLVGVGFASGLARGLDRPVVGVHHIEAHILANELEGEVLQCPCVVLVVSGGHTQLFRVERPGRYELLGQTRDDAAGEAFDKIAKLLGLGFPGGPAIERAAREGRDDAVAFPRAMRGRGFDFSFSGLKTAVRLHLERNAATTREAVADVAASAQRAIVDALVEKTAAAARAEGVRDVYVAGGVAANGVLREALAAACDEWGCVLHVPPLAWCTDNGAMVARAGWYRLREGADDRDSLDVFARRPLATA